MGKIRILICISFMSGSVTAWAQNIDQSLGIDSRVSYQQLVQFGPWDDRNYQLRLEDLAFLSVDEALLSDPIPAFFRVQLRKELPGLRRTGRLQYPRAAVPLFYRLYGGLIQDGRLLDGHGDTPGGGARDLVNGEIKLNEVLGANESTVEINPVNPLRVIAGANNSGGQEMYYSSDGGENWSVQGVLPNTCCDPSIEWSPDGSVAYTASLSSQPTLAVSFWRSFDQGETWVDRVNITSSGSDKEFLHVDHSPVSPYLGNLYLTYHNNNVMQFARSDDSGTTFDITAFSGAPAGIGSDITTTPDGDIYYVYGASVTKTITLLKSSNGGDSFDEPVTVAETNGSFEFSIPAMETRNAWIYAVTDADRSGGVYDGSVYVAWTDTTGPESGAANKNHTVINVAYSRDGGANWAYSNPHSMLDTGDVDRFNQWLKVDESGKVHVVFYDTRNFANRSGVDFYYSYSIDGALSWSEPQRISSQSSQNLSGGQEWGDYNGMSVLGQKLITTWTDNRDGPPNSRNVYASEGDNPVVEPGFTLTGDHLQQAVCAPASLDDIGITVGKVLDYANPVSLSIPNLPTGFSSNLTVNPVNPPGASAAQIQVSAVAATGLHDFHLNAAGADAPEQFLPIQVEVFDAVPGLPVQVYPAAAAVDLPVDLVFDWEDLPQAGQYTLEIDDDPAFGSMDFAIETDASEAQVNDLNNAAIYYWRVRAGNVCGSSETSPAWAFQTVALPGECAPRSEKIELFHYDFEGGDQGWTTSALQGSATWVLSDANPTSGNQHWHADGVAEVSDQVLVSPELSIPSGLRGLTLRFDNEQSIESGTSVCWDGGILEVSTDGGTVFSQIADEGLLSDPYDAPVSNTEGNPLAGQPAWCGDPQPYLNSVVAIDDLAGQDQIQFRFRLATDKSISRPGWDIDDVRITACQIIDETFGDGFENPADLP